MRRWLWLPALLAIGYVAVCALLYVRQRSLIYFPQYTQAGQNEAATDFELPRPVGLLRGWVINPGKPDALIYFGGNAERVQDNREDFLTRLPQRTVYLLPYRGYGGNPGSPSQADLVADAVALHDEVRRRHPHGDVAVVGRSLGSGVASQLAAQRPVRQLVLITPFDSLADVAARHYAWLPVRWLVKDRYDSVSALKAYRGRVLILRAGRDAVVPPANTDRLVRDLGSPPTVVNFPAAGHDDVSLASGYWAALQDFLAPP
ncbi:alpha/beta hydrolase [Pseudoxanthomonas indica]|uniref:AB hydrolase-1 domain-containing protein n=1 Tax=Pseudoxanthomonas indica TaxID=428993 RepID=A0A1T5LZA0_9GAMM|nr:alpha/beta fold hydrolase [Pseudoxanthomonas indica]GGD42766.1 hypothetical protein GCM10007235_13460 [Pseudoxanthomonas indica]SKC81195.1 hypothetical protein SAMN06296058_3475 [Pseudoxanthomonas indica]